MARLTAPPLPKRFEGGSLSAETPRRGLGPVDETQVRLLLSVPPEQRVKTMLAAQDWVIDNRLDQLRRAHPELPDLDLCRLMFEGLYRDE